MAIGHAQSGCRSKVEGSSSGRDGNNKIGNYAPLIDDEANGYIALAALARFGRNDGQPILLHHPEYLFEGRA